MDGNEVPATILRPANFRCCGVGSRVVVLAECTVLLASVADI